ncbi:hypothetical protein HDV06_006172 [Boothiomyces sp. JEL0866]|nr:hypothetical protein HDV06_006172 [Boothiomyces sp. JEL0866]
MIDILKPFLHVLGYKKTISLHLVTLYYYAGVGVAYILTAILQSLSPIYMAFMITKGVKTKPKDYDYNWKTVRIYLITLAAFSFLESCCWIIFTILQSTAYLKLGYYFQSCWCLGFPYCYDKIKRLRFTLEQLRQARLKNKRESIILLTESISKLPGIAKSAAFGSIQSLTGKLENSVRKSNSMLFNDGSKLHGIARSATYGSAQSLNSKLETPVKRSNPKLHQENPDEIQIAHHRDTYCHIPKLEIVDENFGQSATSVKQSILNDPEEEPIRRVAQTVDIADTNTGIGVLSGQQSSTVPKETELIPHLEKNSKNRNIDKYTMELALEMKKFEQLPADDYDETNEISQSIVNFVEKKNLYQNKNQPESVSQFAKTENKISRRNSSPLFNINKLTNNFKASPDTYKEPSERVDVSPQRWFTKGVLEFNNSLKASLPNFRRRSFSEPKKSNMESPNGSRSSSMFSSSKGRTHTFNSNNPGNSIAIHSSFKKVQNVPDGQRNSEFTGRTRKNVKDQDYGISQSIYAYVEKELMKSPRRRSKSGVDTFVQQVKDKMREEKQQSNRDRGHFRESRSKSLIGTSPCISQNAHLSVSPNTSTLSRSVSATNGKISPATSIFNDSASNLVERSGLNLSPRNLNNDDYNPDSEISLSIVNYVETKIMKNEEIINSAQIGFFEQVQEKLLGLATNISSRSMSKNSVGRSLRTSRVNSRTSSFNNSKNYSEKLGESHSSWLAKEISLISGEVLHELNNLDSLAPNGHEAADYFSSSSVIEQNNQEPTNERRYSQNSKRPSIQDTNTLNEARRAFISSHRSSFQNRNNQLPTVSTDPSEKGNFEDTPISPQIVEYVLKNNLYKQPSKDKLPENRLNESSESYKRRSSTNAFDLVETGGRRRSISNPSPRRELEENQNVNPRSPAESKGEFAKSARSRSNSFRRSSYLQLVIERKGDSSRQLPQ